MHKNICVGIHLKCLSFQCVPQEIFLQRENDLTINRLNTPPSPTPSKAMSDTILFSLNHVII